MRPEILLLAALAAVPSPSRAEAPVDGVAGLALGLRPELGLSGDARVGGGLVLEVRHPLGHPLGQPLGALLGLVLRVRGAAGAFDREGAPLGLSRVSWLEGAVTAGVAARRPVGPSLSLEAVLAGGVRGVRSEIAGEGCGAADRCSLSDAIPASGVWSRFAPIGEGSLGLLLLIGPEWGFDLSCTLALSDGDAGRGPVPDDAVMTVRGGVGLRVGLE